MAGLKFTATVSEVALTTASKTVLMVTTPSNQRAKLTEWGVYFDGVSATTEPCVVQLARMTTTGTLSATSAIQVDSGFSETVQSTVGYNASSEPTLGDVIERKNVHVQSGYEKAYGLGEEVWVPGGTRIAIRCILPAGSVNVIPYMKLEE